MKTLDVEKAIFKEEDHPEMSYFLLIINDVNFLIPFLVIELFKL
jgi:hypothetical protein